MDAIGTAEGARDRVRGHGQVKSHKVARRRIPDAIAADDDRPDDGSRAPGDDINDPNSANREAHECARLLGSKTGAPENA